MKGFTLIELLVVMAIIGVLASLVVVSLTSQRGRADDAARKFELAQFNTRATTYYEANEDFDQFCADSTIQLLLKRINGGKELDEGSGNRWRKGAGTANADFDIGCQSDDDGWVAWFKLLEEDEDENESTDTWCRDSSGVVDEIEHPTNTSVGSSEITCDDIEP